MDPWTYVDQPDLSKEGKKSGYIEEFVSAIWEVFETIEDSYVSFEVLHTPLLS